MRAPEAASPRARIALGTLFQTSARVMSLLIGVTIMAYLTRQMGAAEYGRYSLAVVLTGWVGITIGLASGGATVRLVAEGASGSRYATTMLQFVATTAGLVALALCLLASPLALALHAPALASLLRILSADLVAGSLAGVYSATLIAQERFSASAAMLVCGTATQLGVAVLLVESGHLAAGACAAIVSGSLVQLTIGRVASGVPIVGSDRFSFPHLWKRTRLLASAQVALRLNHTLDLPAVKYFTTSAESTGHYAGANAICGAAQMLFSPSTGIVLQSLVRSRHRDDREEAARTADMFVRGVLAYCVLLCALSVLSKDIAPFLLGPAFAVSAPILMILLWATAFRIAATAGRVLISAVGEQTSILVPLLATLGLGCAGYAVVVPRHGTLAAAAIASTTAALTALASLRAGLRMHGLPFPWRSLARLVLAGAVAAGVAHTLPGTGAFVLGKLALACAAYCGVLLALGEWRPDRRHLSSLRSAIAKN